MKFAAGMSKKPRISFMTKGVLEAAETNYQKLLDVMGEGEGARDGPVLSEESVARVLREEPVANEETLEAESASEDVVDREEERDNFAEIDVETRLAEYRERTLALVMRRVEEALHETETGQRLLSSGLETSQTPISSDTETGSRQSSSSEIEPTFVSSVETKRRLSQICAFLLEDGAVYPPDLVTFLTTSPNPAGFGSLPVDRLIEGMVKCVLGSGPEARCPVYCTMQGVFCLPVHPYPSLGSKAQSLGGPKLYPP